jgi:hypothetical protein
MPAPREGKTMGLTPADIERVEAMAVQVYRAAFHQVETEGRFSTEDAGRIAAAAERAFLAEYRLVAYARKGPRRP